MAGIHFLIPTLQTRPLPPARRGSATRLVHALCQELGFYGASHGANETIETAYLAGFPDQLLDHELAALVEALVTHFDTETLGEFTIETDPEAVTVDALRTYRSLGINRIHLRAGSFFQEDLNRLRPGVRDADVAAAVTRCLDAGFGTLSVALAFGLDDQPEEYWMANLQRLLGLGIPHIAFAAPPDAHDTAVPAQWMRNLHLPLPNGDAAYRYDRALRYLQDNGYDPYLHTSFARGGAFSEHHLLIANHQHILGIGPGAHSFWWHGASYASAHRWDNMADPARYAALLQQRQLPVNTRSLLRLDALAEEYVLFQLSTREGLNLRRLETQYGVDLLTERLDAIAELEADALIAPVRNDRLHLTPLGRTHWNEVLERLRP